MTAVQHTVPTPGGKPMSMPEIMMAVSRLQAATEALATVGARASVAEPGAIPPELAEAMDDVLAAAGIPDISELPPPQRAVIAGYARTAFGQAANLLAEPARAPGWSHTDPAVLEGQGRASMLMPSILAQTGEFTGVTSFLDVGAGVGWLAVGATEVWPDCTVVGIETWAPSVERARANIAGASLADRIKIRLQSVVDLDDRDRYDLTWVPVFFLEREILPAAFERILAATRPGGQVVVGRYDPPPDPLARATLRLRTIRDGGSWIEAAEIVDLLEAAGWAGVHVVPKDHPISLTFVAGSRISG